MSDDKDRKAPEPGEERTASMPSGGDTAGGAQPQPSLADTPPAIMSRRGARRAVLAGAVLGAALAAAGLAWYFLGDDLLSG